MFIPDAKTLDDFMTRKAKPIGEHPDAIPVVPLFKDHPEDAWYLQPASSELQVYLWFSMAIIAGIVLAVNLV